METATLSRVAFFKAILWPHWVRVVTGIYAILSVLDFLNSKAVPWLLPMALQDTWKKYYVLPSFTWRTWALIGAVVLIAAALEGAYRFVINRDKAARETARLALTEHDHVMRAAEQRRDEDQKAHEALRHQIESDRDAAYLELAAFKNARPHAVATFRREGFKVFLDIINGGAAGEFSATISANGSINTVHRRPCAWIDGSKDDPTRVIPKGDHATILVLSLDSSLAGLFSWNVHYRWPSSGDQYQHSHGFGPSGVVDADILIEIIIAAKPDMESGVIIRHLRVCKFLTEDADLGVAVTD